MVRSISISDQLSKHHILIKWDDGEFMVTCTCKGEEDYREIMSFTKESYDEDSFRKFLKRFRDQFPI